MENKRGKGGYTDRFPLLRMNHHCNGDCNSEIKRQWLLGRKAMTNLDSVLKSRDISLLTKVCIVMAVVLLVVMYGCQSWTTKKVECQRV